MNQESALEMPSVESLREPMGLQVGSPGVGGACKHVNSPSSSPLSPPPPPDLDLSASIKDSHAERSRGDTHQHRFSGSSGSLMG